MSPATNKGKKIRVYTVIAPNGKVLSVRSYRLTFDKGVAALITDVDHEDWKIVSYGETRDALPSWLNNLAKNRLAIVECVRRDSL